MPDAAGSTQGRLRLSEVRVVDAAAMAAVVGLEGEALEAYKAGFATARKMGLAELGDLYRLLFEWLDAFWYPLPDATDLITRTEDAIYADEAATEAWRKGHRA